MGLYSLLFIAYCGVVVNPNPLCLTTGSNCGYSMYSFIMRTPQVINNKLVLDHVRSSWASVFSLGLSFSRSPLTLLCSGKSFDYQGKETCVLLATFESGDPMESVSFCFQVLYPGYGELGDV